jgi:SAM-dependent methyltransferase
MDNSMKSLKKRLISVKVRLYETLHRIKYKLMGLPIPSAHLLHLVAGTSDVEWFLESGKLGAESITNILARNGSGLDNFEAVLDFGCGCGRVLRYWKHLRETRLYGADYNPELIKWCEQNLRFAQFENNKITPPLSYDENVFDFIYALSVFTHMTEEIQLVWVKELERVLKPGGFLLTTTHGEYYLQHLTEDERKIFNAGKLVVHFEEVAGTNTCAAFHPVTYVREKLVDDRFVLVDFVPEGAMGNPRQDVFLLKKPKRI